MGHVPPRLYRSYRQNLPCHRSSPLVITQTAVKGTRGAVSDVRIVDGRKQIMPFLAV